MEENNEKKYNKIYFRFINNSFINFNYYSFKFCRQYKNMSNTNNIVDIIDNYRKNILEMSKMWRIPTK